MNFIKSNVEWWPQDTTEVQHIARVGRICYKSTPKEPGDDLSEKERALYVEKRDKKRVYSFWDKGHRSMFRHGSVYFFCKHGGKFPKWLLGYMSASSYIQYVKKGHQVWVSTNLQFLYEHNKIMNVLAPFEVTEQEFIEQALEADCCNALWLLRMTFVVTTQISTTRELNRTSPNSIAEQSTRYVNMDKRGGVLVCEPHWWAGGTLWQRFLYKLACVVSKWAYKGLLSSGMKQEDARGALLLDTYSVAAYTYNIFEWQRILDLRYLGRTGQPHPNVYVVAKEIYNTILERMKSLDKSFNL